MVDTLLQSSRCLVCNGNASFAIVRVKGRSKHALSVVAAASITVAPLANFTPSPDAQTASEKLTQNPLPCCGVSSSLSY